MSALLLILTLLGWLAVLAGVVLLIWEFATARILSRPGLAALLIGVVLLIVTAVLSSAAVVPVDYDALPLLH